MKKIIVVIPAYNEEKSIRDIIKRVPKEIEGYKTEILVIDDGSSDKTRAYALETGAIVISNHINKGLGFSLRKGLVEALKRGADIIVNLDADGQYLPEEIPVLIKPILEDDFDLVLGTRFEKLEYKMPLIKKIGNKLVSWWVRRLTHTKISDAQTGFRAIKRELAEILQLQLKGTYTYTQEMIIHAVYNDFSITQVPVHFVKRQYGHSRLIQNVFSYLVRVVKITLSTYHQYYPLRFYGFLSFFLVLFGTILLLIDNFLTLQGIHLIPGINLSDNPKTLLTIFLPIIIGVILIMFGIVLEQIKNIRNSVLQLELLLKMKSDICDNNEEERTDSNDE
ncbi:MAG: glycosyltransferase family 2 protein [Promethearchaeota archaeon]